MKPRMQIIQGKSYIKIEIWFEEDDKSKVNLNLNQNLIKLDLYNVI
jgi:hypothetical protein